MKFPKSVPYLPLSKDAIVVLREPFPSKRKEHQLTYYIRAIVDDGITWPEKQYRTHAISWIRLVDSLVNQDKQCLNAEVGVKNGELFILKHSPQLNFLDMAKEDSEHPANLYPQTQFHHLPGQAMH